MFITITDSFRPKGGKCCGMRKVSKQSFKVHSMLDRRSECGEMIVQGSRISLVQVLEGVTIQGEL